MISRSHSPVNLKELNLKFFCFIGAKAWQKIDRKRIEPKMLNFYFFLFFKGSCTSHHFEKNIEFCSNYIVYMHILVINSNDKMKNSPWKETWPGNDDFQKNIFQVLYLPSDIIQSIFKTSQKYFTNYIFSYVCNNISKEKVILKKALTKADRFLRPLNLSINYCPYHD